MKSRFLLLMGMLSISGCNMLGPQEVASTTTYTLSVPHIQNTNVHDHKITLLVNSPTATPGFDSRKMIYTKTRYELSEFARHQWAAPPAEMLEPVLIQKLRDTGYFHAVINSAFAVQRDYVLKTHLIEMRQDFTVKPSRLRIAMQAELIDTKESRVVNACTFTCSMPAPQNTPYSGVVAANRAVNTILSQVAEFSVKALFPQKRVELQLPKPHHHSIKRRATIRH